MKLTRTSSPRFDPSAKLPLYAQVAERLRALIDNDGLTPGSPLPSETELQRRFRVSRATVRQALQELELIGAIERHQGRGTFVAVPRLERALPELTSFTEHLASKGVTSSSRLLRYERVERNGGEEQRRSLSPDPPDAGLFPADAGPLVRVARLRLANGLPVGLHTALVPAAIADAIGFTRDRLERDELVSLYACLEAAGYRLRAAEEHLHARLLEPREAALLDVPRRTAAMSVLRLTRTEDDDLLEAVRAVYLGDKYDYVIALERTPNTRGR
jgi:GntR family transcriptional regulator